MSTHKLVPHPSSQRALSHMAKPLSFHIYIKYNKFDAIAVSFHVFLPYQCCPLYRMMQRFVICSLDCFTLFSQFFQLKRLVITSIDNTRETKSCSEPSSASLAFLRTWVGSGLTHKHQTRLEKPAWNKYSSFLDPFLSCEENKVLRWRLKIYKLMHTDTCSNECSKRQLIRSLISFLKSQEVTNIDL